MLSFRTNNWDSLELGIKPSTKRHPVDRFKGWMLSWLEGSLLDRASLAVGPIHEVDSRRKHTDGTPTSRGQDDLCQRPRFGFAPSRLAPPRRLISMIYRLLPSLAMKSKLTKSTSGKRKAADSA